MNLRQQYHFRSYGDDTHIWDVNKLLKATEGNKPQSIHLEIFKDQFNSDYWSKEKSITCSNILDHAKLIFEADLSFPILVCPEFKIIDGMHRLCRAFLEKKKAIDTLILKKMPSPDFVNIDPKDLRY